MEAAGGSVRGVPAVRGLSSPPQRARLCPAESGPCSLGQAGRPAPLGQLET